MSLSRRKFFGIVSSGIVATALATKIPLEWVPQAIRHEGAIQFLSTAWRTYMKGKTAKGIPSFAYAGPVLFNAYSNELAPYDKWVNTSDHMAGWVSLMFRGISLRCDPDMGWEVRFEDAL